MIGWNDSKKYKWTGSGKGNVFRLATFSFEIPNVTCHVDPFNCIAGMMWERFYSTFFHRYSMPTIYSYDGYRFPEFWTSSTLVYNSKYALIMLTRMMHVKSCRKSYCGSHCIFDVCYRTMFAEKWPSGLKEKICL